MYEDGSSLSVYMRWVGEIPLISDEKVDVLAERIARGDLEARDLLIQSNLRLVVKIAHDFKGLGLPLIDLISEGNIGLTRAVEKYQPDRGAKFSSYGAWWIKQAMRRALSNQSRTIRIPVQAGDRKRKIKKAREYLRDKLGREPTHDEIAEEVNYSVKKKISGKTVAGLCRSAKGTVSLEASLRDGGDDGVRADVLPDENARYPSDLAGDQEQRDYVLELVERLEPREQLIIRMRYGLDGKKPRTLEKVSRVVGRTRERCRQIQEVALEKLRGYMEEDLMGMEDARHNRY